MSQIHKEPSPLSGQTVKIKTKGALFNCDNEEQEYRVEDWYDRVNGMSWMESNGNMACMSYAVRVGTNGDFDMMFSDEVLYGKVGAFGHLVHVSEIVE